MSDMPYVPFYASDWLAGTRGLTAAQTGVYITLVAMMYERGEPISDDREFLSRACGASRSVFDRALDVLIARGKIISVAGRLWNARVDKECNRRLEKQNSAKASASARWKKAKENQRAADANALHSQCDRNAIQIQSQIREEEPKGSLSERGSDDVDAAFSAYDEMAESAGLPRCAKRTKARVTAVRARLREHGLGVWREALARVAASPHCTGQNDRGWRADLDFIATASKFVNIIEGRYDARPRLAVVQPGRVSAADVLRGLK